MNSRLVGVALHLPALALLVVMDALVKRLAARYAVPQPMWARLLFQPAARPVQPAVLLRPGARPAGRRDRGRLRFAGADRGLGRGVVGWACRVAALGTGLLGVMVALRPSPSPAGAAARAMVPPLGTAMLFAVCQIPTRELVAVDDPHTAILHTSSATAGATSLAQPLFWTAPRRRPALLLASLGLLDAAGHRPVVLAFARAPASLPVPLTYTQPIWATLAGVLVFNEWPDAASLAGAAAIAPGGVLVALPDQSRR